MRKVNGMLHFNAIKTALLKTIGKVNTFALKFTAQSKYLIWLLILFLKHIASCVSEII